jgi:hypothetical protein
MPALVPGHRPIVAATGSTKCVRRDLPLMTVHQHWGKAIRCSASKNPGRRRWVMSRPTVVSAIVGDLWSPRWPRQTDCWRSF